MQQNYQSKYIKYKSKYTQLKNKMIGGSNTAYVTTLFPTDISQYECDIKDLSHTQFLQGLLDYFTTGTMSMVQTDDEYKAGYAYAMKLNLAMQPIHHMGNQEVEEQYKQHHSELFDNIITFIYMNNNTNAHVLTFVLHRDKDITGKTKQLNEYATEQIIKSKPDSTIEDYYPTIEDHY